MSRVLVVSSVLARPRSPAVASAATPELSATDRLDDRRYVATGPRAYVVGTEAGRYPAMGFHTRGEMGGIWTPPIKLLDGIWFGVDGPWIGPATRFTSGAGLRAHGAARPARPERSSARTSCPTAARGVLVGLRFAAAGAEQTLHLDVDAHSELMSAYPWGETDAASTSARSTCPTRPPTRTATLVFTEAARRRARRGRTTGRRRSARPSRRAPTRPAGLPRPAGARR